MSSGQRRHKRYAVSDLPGAFAFAAQAEVLNVSLSGMAIQTTTYLKVGNACTFRLGQGPTAIRLTGKIRWSRLHSTVRRGDEVMPVYQAGIAFDDVLSDAGREVLRFLEHRLVVEPERRVAGRFRLPAASPVDVEAEQGFVVKDVSFSGARIQTDVPLAPGSRFELEIRLDDAIFRTPARVIHVREVESAAGEPRYQAGLEFVDTDDEDRRLLHDFVRRHLEEA